MGNFASNGTRSDADFTSPMDDEGFSGVSTGPKRVVEEKQGKFGFAQQGGTSPRVVHHPVVHKRKKSRTSIDIRTDTSASDSPATDEPLKSSASLSIPQTSASPSPNSLDDNAAVYLLSSSDNTPPPSKAILSSTGSDQVELSYQDSDSDGLTSDEEPMPLLDTMFSWTEGGNRVFVTGTWDNWKTRIPLNKSTKDFYGIVKLPPGVHQYKFIVDGRWKHAPDQPLTADLHGNLNNCCECDILQSDLTRSQDDDQDDAQSSGDEYGQFIPDDDTLNAQKDALTSHPLISRSSPSLPSAIGGSSSASATKTLYTPPPSPLKNPSSSVVADALKSASPPSKLITDKPNPNNGSVTIQISPSSSKAPNMPAAMNVNTTKTIPMHLVDPKGYFDYSKSPPKLPPHLQKALLNMPQLGSEPNSLPLPHHVMLDHLYLMRRETRLASDQDTVILGATHRYKDKFVTTVFYKPLQSDNAAQSKE